MDYTIHGILQARILEWVASFLLQGTFPTQGLEPRSPTLQADSVVAESQGSAVISFCSICLREKQLVRINLKLIHLVMVKWQRGMKNDLIQGSREVINKLSILAFKLIG